MILAFSNNKGGTGKTETCANLAAVLFRQGRRVLVVDTDDQGDASVMFGLNPDDAELNIYHALTGEAHVDDCIYRVVSDEAGTPDGPCIDILPSGDDMAVFELRVLGDSALWDRRFDYLKNILTPIAADYDAILLDTPPAIGLIAGNVMNAAHGILVPFQPEPHATRSLVKVLHQFRIFEDLNDRLEFIGMFVTMADMRTNLHRDIADAARAYADEEGFTAYDTIIPHSIRYSSAVYYKDAPISLIDPEHEMAKAYADLWAEIEEKSRSGRTINE